MQRFPVGILLFPQNGKSREQKQMQDNLGLDHQSSASQAELVCVEFKGLPCCIYIHLRTDFQKRM